MRHLVLQVLPEAQPVWVDPNAHLHAAQAAARSGNEPGVLFPHDSAGGAASLRRCPRPSTCMPRRLPNLATAWPNSRNCQDHTCADAMLNMMATPHRHSITAWYRWGRQNPPQGYQKPHHEEVGAADEVGERLVCDYALCDGLTQLHALRRLVVALLQAPAEQQRRQPRDAVELGVALCASRQ